MAYYIDATHTRTENHLPMIKVREKSHNWRPRESTGTLSLCFVVVKRHFCGKVSWAHLVLLELVLHIHTATESSWQRSNSTRVVQVQHVAQGQLDLFTLRLFTFLALPFSIRQSPGYEPTASATATQHKPSSQEPRGLLVSMLRKVEFVSIALIFLWKCCESGVKR